MANIESYEEDTFVFELMKSLSGYTPEGVKAWIGATDSSEEGVFSWVGPGSSCCPFYDAHTGAIDGAYVNWAVGEPSEAGVGEGGDRCEAPTVRAFLHSIATNASDCVIKYGGGDGKWNDDNWYAFVNCDFFVMLFACSWRHRCGLDWPHGWPFLGALLCVYLGRSCA